MNQWILDVVDTLGWFGVAVLVALENLFPPIPSEVVLPLAGYAAGRGGTSSYLVFVAAATLGSVTGSWALYGIAAAVGPVRLRGFVRRHGRWFGVEEAELDRAEAWFDRRGSVAVIAGRCVPLIRSLVSLPAGVRHMPPLRFTVLTAAGSAVWNAVLIGAGALLGEHWERASDAVGLFQLAVIAAIVVLALIYARRRVNQWLDRRRSVSG